MVLVSKRWILDNVQMLYCSCGVLDLEDIKDFKEPKEGFETNLGHIEKLEVEKGERKETFHEKTAGNLPGLFNVRRGYPGNLPRPA